MRGCTGACCGLHSPFHTPCDHRPLFRCAAVRARACRAVLCLIFHGHALTRLVLDERHIRFKTEDQEQLWRFFYRRGGMGRLEMKQVGCSPSRRSPP